MTISSRFKLNPPVTLASLQAQYVARRFGIFLHFNMATFQDVEQGNQAASPNVFNPSALNVDQWLQNIVASGAKGATLTVKHTDGFCLWPTAVTTHNVSQSSWYAANGQIDIVSEFVSKCPQYGIAPSLYFSAKDFRFEADYPGYTQALYKSYLQAMLIELLTKYGPITSIWLDADVPFWLGTLYYPWSSATEPVNFVHSIQRNCLLINNSAQHNLIDSNIAEYEGGGVGEFTPPGNTAYAESCAPIRSDLNWFWKSFSSAPISAATIKANLATLATRNSAYLLNCGPDNTGNIPSDIATVMQQVGA